MRDKVRRQCPQTTTFEEKGEPKRIRTEIPLLTSITPYRWAKPAHEILNEWQWPLTARFYFFEHPPKWCTYSAIWLLPVWCHVKLLPCWHVFCAHHTTMHQFTVSLQARPHTLGECVFSCNRGLGLLDLGGKGRLGLSRHTIMHQFTASLQALPPPSAGRRPGCRSSRSSVPAAPSPPPPNTLGA